MAELQYKPQARSYRAEGTGDSGWILMPAADVPAQLHLLSGAGRFETTGDSVIAVASNTAIANPDEVGDKPAPLSRTCYPLPTAVRFVDTDGGDSRWSVLINERKGPR